MSDDDSLLPSSAVKVEVEENGDGVESFEDVKELKRCLICWTSSSGDDQGAYHSLPGSAGIDQVDKQLWSFFVLRTLLKYPKHKCADLLRQTRDPGGWFVTCRPCTTTVVAAMKVYRQILELQRKLESVSKEMTEKIQSSGGGNRGTRLKEDDILEMNVLDVSRIIRGHFLKKDPTVKSKVRAARYKKEIYENEVNNEEEEYRFMWQDDFQDEDTDDPLYIPEDDITVDDRPGRKGTRSSPRKQIFKSRGLNGGDDRRKIEQQMRFALSSARKRATTLQKSNRYFLPLARKKELTKLASSNGTGTCNGDQMDGENLQTKTAKLVKGLSLVCPICKRRYTNSYSFSRHRQQHVTYKKFECSRCHYPCFSAIGLKAHQAKLFCRRTNSHKCERCDFVAKSRTHLRKHKKEVHNEDEEVVDKRKEQRKIDQQTRFALYSVRKAAKNLQKSNRKLLPSGFKEDPLSDPEIENAGYSDSEASVKLDWGPTSRKGQSFVCRKCKRTYTNTASYSRHMQQHVTYKEFECDWCHYPCCSEVALKTHQVNLFCLQTYAHKCESCNVVLRSRTQLREHKRDVHQGRGEDNGESLMDSEAASSTTVKNESGTSQKTIVVKLSDVETTSERAEQDETTEAPDENCSSEVGEDADSDPDYLDDPIDDKNDSDWEEEASDKHTKSAKLKKQRGKKGLSLVCPACKREYTNKDSFSQHKRQHVTYKEFECSQCHYPCFSANALRNHQIHGHCLRTNGNKCESCDFVGRSMTKLMEHQRKVHPELVVKKKPKGLKEGQATPPSTTAKRAKAKPFRATKCDICGRLYRNSEVYKQHMTDHEKNKEFKCSKCKYPYSDLASLERHVAELPDCTSTLAEQTSKAEFECPVCSFETHAISLYKLHMKEHKLLDGIAMSDGKLKCNTCQEVFSGKRLLGVHIRTQHPELGLLVYRCELCPKSYSAEYCLKNHVSQDHQKRCKYYCEICGFGTMLRSNLKHHMLKHEENKNFVCDACGASYRYKPAFLKHLRVHHSGKPRDAKMKCKYCKNGDTTFPNKIQLNAHLQTVHKDLFFHKCDECENTYLSVASLQLHKKVNHQSSPTECQFCHKTVTSEYYLYSHYQKFCRDKPPDFRYSVPGVIPKPNRRRDNNAEAGVLPVEK